MTLIYLHAQNLSNTFFMKEFCFQFKPSGPVLILHDHFGSMADTRFVTKRISAMLSEGLVVNNAFSGDQRGLLRREGGLLRVRDELIRSLMQTAPVFILNPIVAGESGPEAADALSLVHAIRAVWPEAEVQVFVQNALSPLAQNLPVLDSEARWQEMRAIYEEESAALDAAWHLRPARLLSARHLVS